MTTTETKIEGYRQQFRHAIDRHIARDEPDSGAAFAAGMLLILSAIRSQDGPGVAMEVALMHKALHDVGRERGWEVARDG